MEYDNPVVVFVVQSSHVWGSQLSLPIGWDQEGVCRIGDEIKGKACCVILMDDSQMEILSCGHTNMSKNKPLLIIEHSRCNRSGIEDWGRPCVIHNFHHIKDDDTVAEINKILAKELSPLVFANKWHTTSDLDGLDALAAICYAGMLGADDYELETFAESRMIKVIEASWNSALNVHGAPIWQARLNLVQEQASGLIT